MKTNLFALLLIIAVAMPAMAQCPASITNPLKLLDGTTWVFQTGQDAAGRGSVGYFKARLEGPTAKNPLPHGVLDIKITTSDFGFYDWGPLGRVDRLMSVQGRYDIYPDCNGGALFFTTNHWPFQYEFVLVNGRTEMLMVSDQTPQIPKQNVFLTVIGDRGFAKLSGPVGCPAGVTDPQQLLIGKWAFQAGDYSNVSGGSFAASIKAGSSVLDVTQTIASYAEEAWFGIHIIRQLVSGGRYQVYPDCSGGILHFNANMQAFQYEFVFAPGFNELYMLSNNPILPPGNISVGPLIGNRGIAKRF
jgi:hypothetical protein